MLCSCLPVPSPPPPQPPPPSPPLPPPPPLTSVFLYDQCTGAAPNATLGEFDIQSYEGDTANLNCTSQFGLGTYLKINCSFFGACYQARRAVGNHLLEGGRACLRVGWLVLARSVASLCFGMLAPRTS